MADPTGASNPLDADALEGTRRRGRRAAHAAVILIAVWFIGASAIQIVPAVFGRAERPVHAGAPGSPGDACAEGVRALLRSLERAGAQARLLPSERAATHSDDDPAFQAWRRALSPEWDGQVRVEQACAQSPEGIEAYASLLRLRRAQEQLVVHGVVELVPLRRDVEEHLPPELR